jgi:hypothetical protein
MAKARTTKATDTSTHEVRGSNGQVQEKLTSKAEALRRALAQLGRKAQPAAILVPYVVVWVSRFNAR